MRKRLSTMIAALALAMAPSMAWADGYFVPFIGANFGGDVGVPLDQVSLERNKLTYGFGVGGMMGGIFGIEFDLGYTHNFYSTEGDLNASGILLTAMPASHPYHRKNLPYQAFPSSFSTSCSSTHRHQTTPN